MFLEDGQDSITIGQKSFDAGTPGGLTTNEAPPACANLVTSPSCSGSCPDGSATSGFVVEIALPNA